MAQALHLMNGPEIEAKITASEGRVARLLAAGADQEAIVDELCLAALGRKPDEDERAVAAELFASELAQLAAEDFLWTLMNSYEFLFIHNGNIIYQTNIETTKTGEFDLLWSTSTESISGTYSVIVTDIFGKTTSNTFDL